MIKFGVNILNNNNNTMTENNNNNTMTKKKKKAYRIPTSKDPRRSTI